MDFAAIGSMMISQAASAASSRWGRNGSYSHLECRPWKEIQEERDNEELERFLNEVEQELDREEALRKIYRTEL